MADFGRRLISSVLLTRDIAAPAQAGVDPSWFRNRELGEVWRFISSKNAEFGSVPTAIAVKASFPTFQPLNVKDDPGFVLDQFLEWHRSRTVYDLVSESVDMLQAERYGAAIDHLRSGISGLDRATPSVSDIDLSATRSERMEEYRRLEESEDGMLGLPTGFPTIDMATAGLQPGQLVTIIASPKTGKSQLALKVAHHINLLGTPVVFQSFEMSNREQSQRFDAIASGVSYDRLRRGRLTQSEKVRLEKHLNSEMVCPFVLSDSSAAISVSALASRISAMDTHPGAVFVDGVYLMIDDSTGESNTPQALTSITRSMKRMAQRLDIPVIITTQALQWKMKGTRLGSDSIGYSSSFLQDSDVLLGLERDENRPEDPIRNLRVVESRQCGPVETTLNWDWDLSLFAEDTGVDVPAFTYDEDELFNVD